MHERTLPNLEDAIRFLDWIGYPVHLVAFTVDQKKQHHLVAQSGGAARDWLEKHEGWNLYFGINEDSKGTEMSKKSDIDAVRFFHIDLDPRTKEDITDEHVRLHGLLTDKLPEGVPPPTVIIFSGGGYQGLWKLEEPIPTLGDPEEVERYTRWLELAFETADSVHNVNRIFRIPGTVNMPTAKKKKDGRAPALARLVSLREDLVYSPNDFKMAPPKISSVSQEVFIPVQKVDDLESLNIPDRLKVIAVQGKHPDEPPKPNDNSRSGWLFDFICGSLRAGLPEGKVLSIILHPECGISESVLEKGRKAEKYARRQLIRAKEELSEFQVNSKEKPLPNQFNIRVALVKMDVHLSYDEWQDRMMFGDKSLTDDDVRSARLKVDQLFGFLPPDSLFKDVVMDTARANSYHPVLDYFDSLVWDQRPRLDAWAIDFGGAEDSPYARAVSSLFMIAAVRRVRKPGTKFDEMLVLEGPQGTNKSSALAALAVRDEWFTDGLSLNTDAQKTIEVLQGKLIAEVAELNGMRRGDVETLKAFLTRRSDKARMAYDRFAREVWRTSVFTGTTNNSRYLLDDTGNRRFWPLRTTRHFDIRGLRSVVDQLWAEAVFREAAGESIRLDESLWDEAAKIQEERRIEDPWMDVLRPLLKGKAGKIKQEDVWRALGLPVEKRSREFGTRVNSLMGQLGFVVKTAKFSGESVNSFVRGDAPHQPIQLQFGDEHIPF